MSKVKCCWFHTPFFFTSFSSFFTIYPQKKLQNSCGNIYGKQNVRSENARKWIKFLKTCPSLKMPKVTLDLKSIHPCLWSVLKKIPLSHFFEAAQMPNKPENGPKTSSCLKTNRKRTPQWKFQFLAQIRRRPAASAFNWTLIPVLKKQRVKPRVLEGSSKSKLKNFGMTQTCRQARKYADANHTDFERTLIFIIPFFFL